jgi:hypothetical protein
MRVERWGLYLFYVIILALLLLISFSLSLCAKIRLNKECKLLEKIIIHKNCNSFNNSVHIIDLSNNLPIRKIRLNNKKELKRGAT